MDANIAEMALSAIIMLVDPTNLLFLGLGVVIGLGLGVIPGLGGLVGLSFLLPFTFFMEPTTAIAFLMGLSSVAATSDTIPAVLFGVPGTVASAATTLDGYPMARRGEAGRALGAAFSASIIGGVFGALLLGISVPILKPVMMAIGTPELLAICVLGLSLVAVLSGGSLLKGLIGVCLGIILAAIGLDSAGELRWAFDLLYLQDGLPLVPVVLGLFALPEIADLVIQRTTIQQNKDADMSTYSQWQGVKDTFKNWFLVLRCSSIGAGLGAIPGIGASILDWIAYGHAAQTEKGASESFGKGDVRGVIASESSNNAKEGGALIPTIAFGVPGTASMAIILGALIIHGIVPGPDMLGVHLDITYTMVWSVALANILGGGLCFLFAKQFAKLATIRIGILAPIILAIIFLGAFQGTQSWGDIWVLLIFGIIGFAMKRMQWSRPPLILGFVLGALIERYLFISVAVFGWDWLFRPAVAIIFIITLYGLLRPVIRHYLFNKKPKERVALSFGLQKAHFNPEFIFAIISLVVFAGVIGMSVGWELESKLLPLVIGSIGTICALFFILVHLFVPSQFLTSLKGKASHMDITTDFSDLKTKVVYYRGIAYFGWCFFYLVSVMVIGLLPAMFVFLTSYLLIHSKEKWTTTLIISLSVWILSYVLFHQVLHVSWPSTMMGDIFPSLNLIPALKLF